MSAYDLDYQKGAKGRLQAVILHPFAVIHPGRTQKPKHVSPGILSHRSKHNLPLRPELRAQLQHRTPISLKCRLPSVRFEQQDLRCPQTEVEMSQISIIHVNGRKAHLF